MGQSTALRAAQHRLREIDATGGTDHWEGAASYGPITSISDLPVSFQALCRPMKMMNSVISPEKPEPSERNGAAAAKSRRSRTTPPNGGRPRSEEHTSELQSPCN